MTLAYREGFCNRHFSRKPIPKELERRPVTYGKYRYCAVEGCQKKHKGYGYCEKHLDRVRRHGDPTKGEALRTTYVDDDHRLCDTCGEVLPAKDFYQHPTRLYYERSCKRCRKLKMRQGHVLRKYGSEAAAVQVAMDAKNPCEICGEYKEGLMAIDHCHDTMKVRGLLCRQCNAGLGQFYDSIEFLESALKYLRGEND